MNLAWALTFPSHRREARAKLSARKIGLDRAIPFATACACKICGALAAPFDAVDFNKYCSPTDCYEFGLSGIQVLYYRCVRCSFLFTMDLDDWTTEQFAAAIYNDEYIKVDGEYAVIRPRRLAKNFSKWLRPCRQLRMLDYGSGAGAFASAMREAGYDRYEEYDPFSHPDRPSGLFDVITCFEVIEHTPDPLASLADMRSLLAPGGCIVLSQTLQPDNLDELRGNWWYLAPRNGHISTYSEESLIIAGNKLGLRYHRADTIYALSDHRPHPPQREFLAALGPSVNVVRLFAPSDPPFADGQWQEPQSDGVWSYRWAASTAPSWSICWQGADLIQIRIPFRFAITPEFAANCYMRMGLWTVPCRVERREIVGEFRIGVDGDGVLELLTPPLQLPTDEQDFADRPLGLAILSQFPVGCEIAAPIKS